MEDVANALEEAKEEIFITDWWWVEVWKMGVVKVWKPRKYNPTLYKWTQPWAIPHKAGNKLTMWLYISNHPFSSTNPGSGSGSSGLSRVLYWSPELKLKLAMQQRLQQCALWSLSRIHVYIQYDSPKSILYRFERSWQVHNLPYNYCKADIFLRRLHCSHVYLLALVFVLHYFVDPTFTATCWSVE